MKKSALCLLSFIWLLLAATVALGCTCQRNLWGVAKSEKDQVKEARKYSQVVFSGRVTEIIVDEKALTFEARFQVLESWKGVETGAVSLFGGTECCFCEYMFEVGESYLLYASPRVGYQNKLGTTICTRTKPLSKAAIDLKYLGKKIPVRRDK
ncbi:MAG TPA: hypothetical protein VJV03_10090 [Pyrinomonadaceae bacterium]|nr:hypothetical protein [Pyrinomonadaceae bacterium]